MGQANACSAKGRDRLRARTENRRDTKTPTAQRRRELCVRVLVRQPLPALNRDLLQTSPLCRLEPFDLPKCMLLQLVDPDTMRLAVGGCAGGGVRMTLWSATVSPATSLVVTKSPTGSEEGRCFEMRDSPTSQRKYDTSDMRKLQGIPGIPDVLEERGGPPRRGNVQTGRPRQNLDRHLPRLDREPTSGRRGRSWTRPRAGGNKNRRRRSGGSHLRRPLARWTTTNPRRRHRGLPNRKGALAP